MLLVCETAATSAATITTTATTSSLLCALLSLPVLCFCFLLPFFSPYLRECWCCRCVLLLLPLCMYAVASRTSSTQSKTDGLAQCRNFLWHAWSLERLQVVVNSGLLMSPRHYLTLFFEAPPSVATTHHRVAVKSKTATPAESSATFATSIATVKCYARLWNKIAYQYKLISRKGEQM